MNYIKHIVVATLFIGATLSNYAQYAGSYIGVPITLEVNPHPEAYLENGGLAITTAPTCVTPVMSWDTPGGVDILEGYASVLTSNLVLSNSQHLSLVMGSEPNDPNGIATITPFNGTYEKGINIDRLWVGRKDSPVSIAYSNLIIETVYDTLIVDEVWVPEGATLEIVGQYPLIVRKELHNKGTIICDENLLLPVYTDGDITPKGFHAMFEQKGSVIGRYSSEIMINEKPEFINWDWVMENFGGGATYLDSLVMLGFEPEYIAAWNELYEQHLLEFDEPWYAYLLELENTNQGWHRGVQHVPPVKGVRLGPHYQDYERVAIYKDSYKRFPNTWSWPAEMSWPTDDISFLTELGAEVAGVTLRSGALNYYHNVVLNGAPDYFQEGSNTAEAYIAGDYTNSYIEGEWEHVGFMRDTTSWYNGYRTRQQYDYPPDTLDPYSDFWHPAPPYMYEDPGYPDDIPFPWEDGDIEPEYMLKASWQNWTGFGTTLGSSAIGQAFTAIDTELPEVFVSFQYCRSSDVIYAFDDPYVVPALWLADLPAQGLDTLYRVGYRGCTDTITSTFGLFDLAANSGDIYWNFSLMNDFTTDDIWNYTELMEVDTTVAGYDSIYDYQWYYRDDVAAAQSIFNGWDLWFNQNPAQRFNVGSPTGYWWFDVETSGSNGNQLWEHPDHMFPYDTAGRHYPALYANSLVNWDSIADVGGIGDVMYLQPKLSDWIDDIPELAYLEEYYPDSTRMQQVRTDPNQDWWGATWMLADFSTPMPFPIGIGTHLWNVGSTEIIERYTGYSWMNTLEAYDHPDMQYHPQPYSSDALIPNLPPNNSSDHTIRYSLPTAIDWVYTYAPNGLLYEAETWSECINQNDTLYCINYFDGNNLSYDEWGISTYQDLTDLINVNYDQTDLYPLDFNNYTARRNRHGTMANPTQGYLDMDAVAAKYFEDNPDANHLEFAWWNNDRTEGSSNTNPGNVYNAAYEYWRRKYHKYGDELVSDEVEYFITLLADQFIAQSGEGFNAELTNVILSFLANNDPNDSGFEPGSPMWNWLISAPVNPNGYVPFGQYALPGAGFFARNTSGEPVQVEINADMAVYDFEWPLTTGNEIYLGSAGPGSDYDGYGGRQANAQPASSSIAADHSTVVVLDWLNDSTYMPWVFLHHRFMDDASNGSEQLFEDNQSLLPNFPWVFTDSSSVRPANYVEEYGPHNQDPLYVNIPRPLDSAGAWCFIPTLFQDTGSVWYDPEIGQIYTRLGLELFDGNGDITNILYLDRGDTLWVRFDDPYDWPIKGKMYFTNLVGDISGDGVVNILDILVLLTSFNECIEDNPNVAWFDTNGDDCLTTSDLLVIMANFGQTIGSSVGDFSGSVFDTNPDGPERFSGNDWEHPDWPTAELANLFTGGEFASIYEFGDVSTSKVLSMFGETIQVFNTNLQAIVTGVNSVQLPLTGGPYLVVTDRSMGYYDVNEVPNVVETTTASGTVSDADGGRTAVLPSRAATYPLGTAQFWTDFYNDMKAIDYAADGDLNDAPTLAQIYYGINSGVNANQLNPQNAKIEGLIDIFGAGDASHGYTFESTNGAHTDDRFNATAKAYTTFKQNRDDPIFEPTMVPLAYALPRVNTQHDPGRTLTYFETNSELDRKFNDGIAENFDVFSELAGRREPGVTEWGGDIKKYYDVPLHNGVMAMCDFMTLKDYFEFKMYGVSPKFGQTNAGSTSPRTTTESFGTVYNTGAVEGVPNGPGIGYAPSRCNNLADYTTYVVAPFISANIGNVVVLPQDPTPVIQDGVQRNIDNAGHYNWFGNSAAFVHNGSFGPLVYDFNMSGTWDAEDLTIWNNLVAAWTAFGITEGTASYADASYYRPATDALNEVVNVIQNYDEESSYQASWNFNKWFDATATAEPLSYVNNWFSCLNQPEWNLNLLNPTVLTTTAFEGQSVQEDYFFYNGTRTGFNPDLLNPTTLNTYGKVAINDYVPEADLYEYQVVPSSNYFPVTMYWHP